MANLTFDTCVFIDFLRGDEAAKRALERVIGRLATDEGFYSVWTMLELLQRPGITPVEQVRRTALLKELRPISLTSELAEAAGLLAADVRNPRPDTILGDAVIAVSALSVRSSVVTRNLDEFSLLKAPVEPY